MKPFAFVFLAVPFVFVSCTAPQFFSKEGGSSCACEDGSWKYWPKWGKCGEILKEKIWKQGYYGELEVSKSPAYYSKDCRSE